MAIEESKVVKWLALVGLIILLFLLANDPSKFRELSIYAIILFGVAVFNPKIFRR